MPVLYKQKNPSLQVKSRLGFFDLLYPLVAMRVASQAFLICVRRVTPVHLSRLG